MMVDRAALRLCAGHQSIEKRIDVYAYHSAEHVVREVRDVLAAVGLQSICAFAEGFLLDDLIRSGAVGRGPAQVERQYEAL